MLFELDQVNMHTAATMKHCLWRIKIRNCKHAGWLLVSGESPALMPEGT